MKKLLTIKSSARTYKGVQRALIRATGDDWTFESVWEGMTDGSITADGKTITVYVL